MIVDLERRVIADLLPDRETEAVAGWLRRHPGVDIVARDRAEVYGEAVRLGAPEAVTFHQTRRRAKIRAPLKVQCSYR